MIKTILAQGCAIAALSIGTVPAFAKEPAPAAPAAPEANAPDEQSEGEPASDIIVTGSARPQRRFDVSYAVNSLSQNDIKKLAPLNMADLLGKLPGIQVEATGGEVQNVTRVRGIPTDRGFLTFQQDGLPLFHELDGFFFNGGEGMNRLDLMTDRIEVVRGGPAPIYASNAAAIANTITVTGTDTTRGKAQVTLGTTGLYRLDGYQAGPLGERTFYAIGGFLRQNDGFRDNGFPSDRGGQIRANIKHDFDNGSIKLSVNYLNDHNVFYLPIPIADPRNPSVSLNPYIDYFTGTMNSPSLRNVNQKYLNGAGALVTDRRDLADGRHMQYGNVGLQYEGTFGGWRVSAKGGFTKGKVDFDAFYSTSNPADATTFANGFLTASKTAFGAVDHLGYAIGGTGGAQVYNPAAASGLVMQAQYRAVGSSFYSTQGDLSVTRKFETGLGTHDLKIGVYSSAYGETSKLVYQDFLIEVASKPRTLDLIAYSATNAILGSVTDKGVLRYTTTLSQGNTDATMFALYANDTWEITPGLRVDGGIRHERYHFNGYALLTDQVNLGDATTLADNATRFFTGAIQTHVINTSLTNWSIGGNYDFSQRFGIYARAAHLEVPPSATVASSVNPVILTTKADQYEAGLKASFGRSYLYVTGFYTRFDPFNASFLAFNPVTGRNDQAVPFIGKVFVKGAEIDGALRPNDWFTLAGSLTVQDPHYSNLVNSSGADPAAVNGKQIIREPKIFGNIRPSVNFDWGKNSLNLYGSYEYTGKRYVDLFNLTALPAWGKFTAGVTLSHGTWQFQAAIDNITNAHGLTEGNPRTDQLAGQGSTNAIYGRPLFGRNARFVLSKSW